MEPAKGDETINWSKATMVAVSLTLGGLLFCGLQGLGRANGIDSLADALKIVAAPGALVLIIVTPYLIVRSGEDWVEKRHEKATLKAETARCPSLSLLRASEPFAPPDEALLRPAVSCGDADPHELLRSLSATAADTERG